EGNPGRVPAGTNPLSESGAVRRAASVVDVAPVGRGGQDGDVGAEAPEDLRCDLVGGTVGTIDQYVQPVEMQVGEAGLELSQVVLVCASKLAHAPNRSSRPGIRLSAHRYSAFGSRAGGGAFEPQLLFDRGLVLV